MEVIRRNFFNGHDGSIRKATWFNWDKALASKKNGGLGVSSFFAQNRVFIFNMWVWRFYTDKSSLWSSFIKAMHGSHGAIGDSSQFHNRSTWRDILNACQSLKAQDHHGEVSVQAVSISSSSGYLRLALSVSFNGYNSVGIPGMEKDSNLMRRDTDGATLVDDTLVVVEVGVVARCVRSVRESGDYLGDTGILDLLQSPPH
ncbi:hypothetical protein Tco_0426047 [Tanacetum coccineum]